MPLNWLSNLQNGILRGFRKSARQRVPRGRRAPQRIAVAEIRSLEERTLLTALGAGDIAVIGYNTNASPDSITIVALKALDAGTQFFVNDNEVSTAGGTSFTDLNEGEASFTVKAGQSISAGTVITLPWGAGAVNAPTYDWSSTSGFGLGNNNEEVYVYTAPAISSITPDGFIYFAKIGSSSSSVPAGLTLGTSSIAPSGSFARYKTAGATYSGTQTELLTAISNTSGNWEAVAPVSTTDWTFTLAGSNVAPVLALPGGVVNYIANDPPTIIDATATVTDTDSADFDTGGLTVDFTANGSADDRLEVRNQGTGAGQIGVSGADITFGGITIGTYNGGIGATPLVVTLNANATPAVVESLARNITFRNASSNPSTLARTVRFVVTDGEGGTSSPVTETINVSLPANDAPTVSISPVSGALAETTSTASAIELSTITIADDGVGTNVLSLTGADAAAFEIVGDKLRLKAGTALDFETKSSYTVNVNVDDSSVGATPDDSKTYALTITDVTEVNTLLSPGDVAITAFQADNSGGGFNGDAFEFVLLAPVTNGTTIFFTDNGFRTDLNSFRTNENVVRWVAQSDLPAGTVVTFTAPGGSGAASTPQWTGINPVTGAALTTAAFGLAGGGDSITALQVPTFGGADALTGTALAQLYYGGATFPATNTGTSTSATALAPGLSDGVNAISLAATDNGRYDDTAAGSVETGSKSAIAASVNNDAFWQTSATPLSPHNTTATFTVTADNQAPTAVALQNATTALAEQTLAADLKLADISVTDDGQGTNVLSLSGADAVAFTIVGTELFLKAGTYDFETQSSYSVIVNVDDSTVGSAPDANTAFTLTITNVNEQPTITSGNTFNVPENVSTVGTVTATDPENATLTYTITGGVDAALFSVNPNTGALTFLTAPNFEAPADAGGNNVYDVTVQVSDGTNTVTQAIAVTVTNANESPTVTNAIPDVTVRQGAAPTTIDLLPIFADPETPDTSLTYTISANSNPALFSTVQILGGQLTLTYDPTKFGTSTITVRAEDSGSLFAEETFVVRVNYTLQLLHLADGEAGLLAPTTAPNLAALIDAFDNDYNQTLILAGGDNWIPGPFLAGGTDASVLPVLNAVSGSTIAAGTAIPIGAVDIAIHNEMGVEVSAIGNHEFDLGSRVFRDSFSPNLGAAGWVGANFAHVSANLDFSGDADLAGRFTNTLDGGTGTLVPEASTLKGRLVPATVVTKNGERIGIVGATTQLLEAISSPSGTEVKGFPTGPGPNGEVDNMALLASHLQPVIDELRAEGINKIVLMAHLQVLANEEALAPLLSGVDIILAAGSNTRLGDADDVAVAFPGHSPNFANNYPLLTAGADGKPTLIINTDNEYTYLGRLVIDFNDAGEINVSGLPELVSINGAYAATESNVAAAWAGEGGLAAAFAEGTKGEEVADLTTAVQSVITAKDGNVAGFTNVYLQGERIAVRNQETNLGNLSADANADALMTALGAAASTTFIASLKNGGGIRAQIGSVSAPDPVTGEVDLLPPAANPDAGKPAGGVSQLDIENSLRFNNTLMAFDTTAAGLKAILEHGVALLGNQGRFPQIGGVRFSYNPSAAAGSRIQNIALIDENDNVVAAIVENGIVSPSAPSAITVVTLGFLANGGDSYPIKANADNFRFLLTDGTFSAPVSESLDFTAAANVPVNALGEQTSLFDYMQSRYGSAGSAYNIAETPATLDTRIQNLSVRSDGVFSPNTAPTIALQNTITSLPENTNTTTAMKVADIVVTDDVLGTNVLSLSGTDAASFEIVGTELRLKAGVVLDFETKPTYDVTVSVDDASVGSTPDASVNFTLSITNVNELPTITSGNTFNVPENTTAVSTVTATDPENASLTYTISGGADGALFTINPSTGVLSFQTAPNFELPTDAGGNNIYDVTVQVSDGTNNVTQAIAVTVINVNESPTITSGNTFNVPENATAVGTVTATDPENASLTYSISGGLDAALFAIHPTTGALTFQTAPNFELPADDGGNNVYNVTVQVSDSTNNVTQAITIAVSDVNEAPTITSGANFSVPENTTPVTTVTATEPESQLLTYSISGGVDAALFAINPTTGALTFQSAPNFEAPADTGANNIYDVTVQVSDGMNNVTQAVAVTVTNVNEAPTAVVLTPETISLPEDTSTASAVNLTSIAVTDDALGTNVLTLSGADAAAFEIQGTTLRLKSGTVLDFETKSSYMVIVNVDDASVGTTPDASTTFTLTLTDVTEAPEIEVTVNGSNVADGGSVSFGAVTTGTASTRTFTVRNTGNASLNLQPISITGSDFTVNSGNFTSGQTLAVNATASFTVTMNTTTASTKTGSLSFANTDGNENPFNFSLTGSVTATGATPIVIDDGDTGFSLAGTWSNISGYGFGSDAKAATGNTGTKTATWTFTGLTAGTYQIDASWLPGADRASNAPYTIRNGVGGAVLSNILVNQKSAPVGAASQSGRPFATLGTVTITGDTLVVELANSQTNGAIIADALRIISMAPAPSTPEIEVRDGALTLANGSTSSFGEVTQGATVTKTFTVKNTGTADLVLQPITVTGAAFSLVSANFTPGQTLAPNAEVTITVSFNTATVGTFSGGLSFGNSDADEGAFNLLLTGKVNASAPTSITIDDGDAGFALAGTWSNVAGYGFGGDAKVATGNTGTKTSTWTFTGLADGVYQIDTTWLSGSDRANNAPYTFSNGLGGSLGSAMMNQRVNPSGAASAGGRPFGTIGTVTVTGGTLVIQLSNTATNGAIIADAMRLTKIA